MSSCIGLSDCQAAASAGTCLAASAGAAAGDVGDAASGGAGAVGDENLPPIAFAISASSSLSGSLGKIVGCDGEHGDFDDGDASWAPSTTDPPNLATTGMLLGIGKGGFCLAGLAGAGGGGGTEAGFDCDDEPDDDAEAADAAAGVAAGAAAGSGAVARSAGCCGGACGADEADEAPADAAA